MPSSSPTNLDELRQRVQARRFLEHELTHVEPASTAYGLESMQSHLVEISSERAAAGLTLAATRVLEAQRRGEPAAWVQVAVKSTVYPPDLDALGIDLAALLFVRPEPGTACARTRQERRTARTARFVTALRAVDHLLRSRAFGLIVLDLGRRPELPMATCSRLSGLAKQSKAAVLALTRKRAKQGSLGSLVSLRLHATYARVTGSGGAPGRSRFRIEVKAIKDKRGVRR